MDFPDDPEQMSPQVRLAELAAILAAGILRASRARLASDPAPPPFTENPLDSSVEPMPLCVEGWTGGESEPREAAR